VDTTPIEARLGRIRKSVFILGELQRLTYEAFIGDERNISTAERHLQLAIQAALDIGQHILSELMVEAPSSYADVFTKLGKVGAVPTDFAERLADMARFRNILVHLYLEVDPEKVYYIVQHNLEDFERFAQYVTDFVARHTEHGKVSAL